MTERVMQEKTQFVHKAPRSEFEQIRAGRDLLERNFDAAAAAGASERTLLQAREYLNDVNSRIDLMMSGLISPDDVFE
jgi:hypothetical protein